jgi:hypothetical protein
MRCERVCQEWKQMIHYVDESRERLLELRGKKRRKGKDTSKQRPEGSRQFWISVCDLHFKEAMLDRRKFPSKIQPVTVSNAKIY